MGGQIEAIDRLTRSRLRKATYETRRRTPAVEKPEFDGLNEIGRCALIERLDLDDRRAVIAADPQDRPIGRAGDEDAADVGRPRQQIVDDLAGLRIEPSSVGGEHRAGTDIAV